MTFIFPFADFNHFQLFGRQKSNKSKCLKVQSSGSSKSPVLVISFLSFSYSRDNTPTTGKSFKLPFFLVRKHLLIARHAYADTGRIVEMRTGTALLG